MEKLKQMNPFHILKEMKYKLIAMIYHILLGKIISKQILIIMK
jgi:hypothetical protein